MTTATRFYGPFLTEGGPSVQLRSVAFVSEGGESAAEALTAAGAEIIQELDALVIAAFTGAGAAMRACASLPEGARAGVSCGDVLYEDGLVHGLPVIEASRLLDATAPGQVLCTLRLVRAADAPSASFRSVAPIELRGLATPTTLCELRGAL